jgi:hypothetical protein
LLIDSTETEVADSAVVQSIRYEMSMSIVVTSELKSLQVSIIKLILINNEATFFVIEPKSTFFDFDLELHVLLDDE